jgi:ADP-ribose pyrophosphatase YjhB (NUDIX family)
VSSRGLTGIIAALEAEIGDPRVGLPEDVFRFVSRLTPLINVDLLIQDERRRTLLTWRDDEFYGAGWHIPGGIIRYKETAEARIRACADEELGAGVSFDPVPLLLLESIESQKDRGHFLSLLFRCRLIGPPDPAREALGARPAPGAWRWHDGPPADLLDVHRRYAQFL